MGDFKLDRRQLDVLTVVKAVALLVAKICTAARAGLRIEIHSARGCQGLLLTARVTFLASLGAFAIFTLSLRAVEGAVG